MLEEIKRNVGVAAAEMVQEGMVVGLGTGSTAGFFIEALISRCKEGLNITAVATSQQSRSHAEEGGITVLDINDVEHIDLTVDGADKVDSMKRIVKGLGGALLREKIVATASKEVVVIVDEVKVVSVLEDFVLPVEVVPFGWKMTLARITAQGYRAVPRNDLDGKLYITDNGNYIVDIHHAGVCKNPEMMHHTILTMPGVVETGFFFGLASRIVIGNKDGSIEIR
jgi:ribose 5-phosphate isomerase A